MHKKWLLLAAVAAMALFGGLAPAANAQSIWGNGSPIAGSASNQTVFSVNGVLVRCTVTVNGGVAGPSGVSSAPFQVTYTNCSGTIGGVTFPVTVSGGNPSVWNVTGGSFNPATGVWSNTSVTRTSPITISFGGIGCVITIPAGTVLTTNGGNQPAGPGPWTGTSMNMQSTTVPFTTVGCPPPIPASGTNGTVIIIIIVINWWDP